MKPVDLELGKCTTPTMGIQLVPKKHYRWIVPWATCWRTKWQSILIISKKGMYWPIKKNVLAMKNKHCMDLGWVESPYRPGLIEGWTDLGGGPSGRGTGDSTKRVTIMENGCGCEYRRGESRRNREVVVFWNLISSEQDRTGLAQMEVHGRVRVLERMRSFHLHQFHGVTLYSKVDGCCYPHIRYPEPVCLACKQIFGGN